MNTSAVATNFKSASRAESSSRFSARPGDVRSAVDHADSGEKVLRVAHNPANISLSRGFSPVRRGAYGFTLPATIIDIIRQSKMEPISHFFYSDRLKLQFWDYGQDAKPALVLVHGGLDHARNWDWVARSLREHYHVYALDLRGHGNSAWAPGALYSIAEHVLDLSVLLEIIHDFPVRLIGHSLGGGIVLSYSGVYPARVG